MHDRRVEPGLLAFVQEDRVEHLPRRRIQAERDIRKPQRGLHIRVPLLQLADGLDCLDAVLARLFLARANGEGQAVDQNRRLVDTPVRGDVVDEALGDLHLLLGGAGLALLVDGQRDHGGAVLGDQFHGLGESRLRPVAVLVVHRVDGATATEVLQTCLQHRGFGGVQHDRQRRRGCQPAGQRGHVGGAVAADVVDAEIQQMRAVAGLLLGDVEAFLIVLGDHRLAKRLGAVGVRALPDHQHRRVLGKRR